MKLIKESSSLVELQELEFFLETKGIPCFIQGENTYQMRPLYTGFSVSIYVIDDEQYFDACALLKNQNHHVKSPKSADEMTQIKSEQRSPQFAFNVLMTTLTLLILTSIVVFVVYRVWLT